jgi:hypothetical protein
MILEGLRASFTPHRRSEPLPRAKRARPATPLFRSAPGNVAKLPRNPRRHKNVVKPYRSPKPTIRRNTVKTPAEPETPNLPQVASFGD